MLESLVDYVALVTHFCDKTSQANALSSAKSLSQVQLLLRSICTKRRSDELDKRWEMWLLEANNEQPQICPRTSSVGTDDGKGNDALAAFCRMRRREVRATAALWATAGQPANCVHRGAQAEYRLPPWRHNTVCASQQPAPTCCIARWLLQGLSPSARPLLSRWLQISSHNWSLVSVWAPTIA